MSNEKSSVRTRSWTFILYPESAPANFIELLNSQHLQFVVSPLHEFDVNETGEIKKPHYHILIIFNGKKSFEQVNSICSSLNCPIPQICHNAKGLLRYFLHLDNPEKFQYNRDEIREFGGVDVDELLKLSITDEKVILKEIMAFIRDNNILEYYEVLDYAADNNSRWYDLLLTKHTYLLKTYLNSKRNNFLQRKE